MLIKSIYKKYKYFFFITNKNKNKKKIIDCFIFYNEIQMLLFRLKELYHYVDYFIIVEANQTFSGKSKEFNLQNFIQTSNLLNKYIHKIIYIKVDDIPNSVKNAWHREFFQRNCILRGLQKLNLNNNDIIIIGDVDEIPKTKILKNILFTECDIQTIQTIQTDFYYYNINCKHNRKWNANVILPYIFFTENKYTPQQLRNKRHTFTIIQDGGWHFSYFSDTKTISNKIKDFSHQELNLSKFTDRKKIKKRICECKDLFDRKDHKLQFIPIHKNNNLPKNYKLLFYLKK